MAEIKYFDSMSMAKSYGDTLILFGLYLDYNIMTKFDKHFLYVQNISGIWEPLTEIREFYNA